MDRVGFTDRDEQITLFNPGFARKGFFRALGVYNEN